MDIQKSDDNDIDNVECHADDYPDNDTHGRKKPILLSVL